MDTYNFIKNLFTDILAQSKAIEGRFHMSSKYGAQEINSDNLGELTSEIPGVIFPLSLMPPPTSRGSFTNKRKGEWERFRIIIFFVKQTYYGPGADINPDTHTSEHTVQMDWDDMKRCAIAFKEKLELIEVSTLHKVFRVPDNQCICHPVSSIGSSRVSGVKFDFDFDIYIGCKEEQDYEDFVIPELNVNAHPEHLLT